MSDMNLTYNCGYCGALTVSNVLRMHQSERFDYRGYFFSACNSCSAGNMHVYESRLSQSRRASIKSYFTGGGLKRVDKLCEQVWSFPSKTLSLPPHMPDKVELVYERAEKAFCDGHWSAASLLFRKTIEQTCKDKGHIAPRSLYGKIEAMHGAGELTDDLKEWASEIKDIGNESAHDDPLPDNEAKSNASDTRGFCNLFITYIYTLPGQLSLRRSLPTP